MFFHEKMLSVSKAERCNTFMELIFMISDKYSKKQLVAGIAVLLLVGVAVFGYVLYGRKSTLPSAPIYSKNPVILPTSVPRDGETLPAQTLDLSNWKLTLPITSPGDPAEPLDILQPELTTFQMSPWFMLTSDKRGVVFRAPVNAPTTANSDYPRSELREMTDNGQENAYWPSKKGTHTLFLDEAITAVPKNKPQVVAGQIHGDDDDLIVIRLDFPKLYVSRGKSNLETLDENYTLGKRFTIKFVAEGGQIAVYYNNGAAPVYTLKKKVDMAYFKAGVYTQSNCETEGASNLCNADNFGEVIIYQAVVTHQ